jgi:hypothetical protein
MTQSRLLIATLALLSALFCFSSASAQTNDRAQAVSVFEGLLGKMQAVENRLLAVSDEDKAAFADFLKQPDTGLIRFDVSDALVAFRVTRQDQDGSVVLLWKTLKKFPAPTAIRENRSR